MKQYLTPDQTAKLIELGFEPRIRIEGVIYENGTPRLMLKDDFDIAQLIEMLPEKVTDKHGHDAILQMTCFNREWRVKYAGAYDVGLMLADELIDALYYMILQLKEEGVI